MVSPPFPAWLPADAPCTFPDPSDFDATGLIAGGGDLSPERLLAAYRAGLFPWYDESPVLWWCPDPRAILSPDSLHISRSLKRRLMRREYMVTCNQTPREVMDGCADRLNGTWLNDAMKNAYLELYELGHMISFEVWDQTSHGDRELVGGLYGVLVDGLFAAESKFHRKTDASKIALVCAVVSLFNAGVCLFDVQFSTEHLESMGVYDVSRHEYLTLLAGARQAVTQPLSSGPDLTPQVIASLGF